MRVLQAVIYTRVSTDDQADYGTGLDTQRLESTRFAERLGISVVGAESDPGVSGTIYPRPGLERALCALEAGKANALIVHRVDRLGRKVYIPPLVYERVKAAGAYLFSVEDGEVTENNILVFALRCGLAQTDYNRILQNLQSGKRRLAEKGRAPSRSLSPYGYHIVQKIENGQLQEDAGKYVIVEEEARVVREIYSRYAAGDSLSSICKWLHSEGISIPKPDKATARAEWQPTMVFRIVKNTIYKGYTHWGRTVTTYKDRSDLPLDERINCRKNSGRMRIVHDAPENNHVRIEAPAIVSEALWDACQKRREDNKNSGGARNDRRHIFASLMVCPNCGRRMIAGRAHYKHREPAQRPVLYRCRDYAPSQTATGYVCNNITYKEQEIRESVRRFLTALVETPEFIVAAYHAHQALLHSDYSQEEHMKIINSLRELDEREKATAQGYTRAIQLGTRPEVFENLLIEIATERRRLLARKESLESQLTKAHREDPQSIAQIASQYARDMLEVFDSETLDSAEKNTRFRRILDNIRPVDRGYRIEARPIQVDIQEAPVTSIVVPVR